MPEVDSTAYPQMVDGTGCPSAVQTSLPGPLAFMDGEGVLFMRAAKVTAVEVAGNTVKLVCETRGSLNRTVHTHETALHELADTAETGVLYGEIVFWSPAISRVRFSTEPLPQEEPAFPPREARMLVGEPRDVPLQIEETAEAYTVSSSVVSVRIQREPFHLQAFAGEKLFWEQRRNELFTADIFDTAVANHAGRTAAFESFALAPQEEIFGLGERFDHVTRRGKAVDFWNKDAIGTSNTRTYINVPFLLSTRGYGLFVNSTCRTQWEIGTRDAETLGFAVEDGVMDYFIIYGPTPAEVVRGYCTLTGFAPTPPIWSFGLWMSRNSYASWDVVHEVADGVRARGIPADVLHLDTYWFNEDFNCDLRFNEERFAEPERHFRALKEQDFRISLWLYNFVPPRANNANYVEGAEKGYFAHSADGTPWRLPEGTVGSWTDDAVIDFSNPEASAWFTGQIKALIAKGAAAIKTDFGEGIPEDAIYQNIDGRRFHNLYSLVYNAAVAQAIHEVTGEHIVWARSGTAGSQRYPIHWGGDSQCNWSGLTGTLRAALSIGLSGFPFFSHDIGGFIGRPTPELYIRWAQYGLFSSHSRCHGCGLDNSREPWSFGEEANRIFTDYARLRYRLLPYIYDQARKATVTAKPLVRALLFDYPADRNVWHIDDQYLFGDAFLIAPVLAPLQETTTRTLYLPRGTWIDYWTKAAIHSTGEWITREVDLETMPIYVKAGSILPYGEEKDSTRNAIGPITCLEVYTGADSVLEYDDGEKQFTARLEGERVEISGLDPQPAVEVFGGGECEL